MRSRLLALAAVVVVAALARGQEPPAPPPDPDGPRAKFAERELDFGTAVQGDKVKRTFKLTNSGKAPLVVRKVEPSCGCTVGRVSKEQLAPGDTGEIDVVFDSQDRTGFQQLRITVYTNDPTQEDRGRFATNLTLRGEVRSLYRLLPTGAYFGLFVRSQGPRTLDVRIGGTDEARSWKALAVTSPAPWIKVEHGPLEAGLLPEGSTQGIKLQVTLLPSAPLGNVDPLAHLITIETDQKRQPRIRIPVIAVVVDGVRGPDFVHLPRVGRAGGREQTHAIERVDGKVGLKLTAIEHDATRLEIVPEPVIEGIRIDLRISVKKDAPVGPFATTVRVRTDDPEVPVVDFPVFGEVAPRVSADPAAALARGPVAQGAVVARIALSIDAAQDPLEEPAIEGTDLLQAKLVREPGTRPVVVVTAAKAIDGPLDARLVIPTTIAGEDRLVVPVRVTGTAK